MSTPRAHPRAYQVTLSFAVELPPSAPAGLSGEALRAALARAAGSRLILLAETAEDELLARLVNRHEQEREGKTASAASAASAAAPEASNGAPSRADAEADEATGAASARVRTASADPLEDVRLAAAAWMESRSLADARELVAALEDATLADRAPARALVAVVPVSRARRRELEAALAEVREAHIAMLATLLSAPHPRRPGTGAPPSRSRPTRRSPRSIAILVPVRPGSEDAAAATSPSSSAPPASGPGFPTRTSPGAPVSSPEPSRASSGADASSPSPPSGASRTRSASRSRTSSRGRVRSGSPARAGLTAARVTAPLDGERPADHHGSR